MVELNDEEKKRVFQMKTVEAKTYKQIQEAFKEEGKEVSPNQIREVVRLGVHGKSELATQLRIDVLEEIRDAMGELNEILKLAKKNQEYATAIGAINAKLKALETFIRYEGKWSSSKTQVNVLIIEMEKEYRNWFYKWVLEKLPKETVNEFQHDYEVKDREIQAKYRVVE